MIEATLYFIQSMSVQRIRTENVRSPVMQNRGLGLWGMGALSGFITEIMGVYFSVRGLDMKRNKNVSKLVK